MLRSGLAGCVWVSYGMAGMSSLVAVCSSKLRCGMAGKAGYGTLRPVEVRLGVAG